MCKTCVLLLMEVVVILWVVFSEQYVYQSKASESIIGPVGMHGCMYHLLAHSNDIHNNTSHFTVVG